MNIDYKTQLDELEVKSLFDSKADDLLSIENYDNLISIVMNLDKEVILRFLANRFITPVFLSNRSNTMIKAFMFLKIVAKNRNDISLEDFNPLLKYATKIRATSKIESERMNLIKSKIVSDILVPIYIREVVTRYESKVEDDNRFIRLEYIQSLVNTFFPKETIVLEAFENSVAEAIEKMSELHKVEPLNPFEKFQEEEKDEVDREITKKYLEAHPEEFIPQQAA